MHSSRIDHTTPSWFIYLLIHSFGDLQRFRSHISVQQSLVHSNPQFENLFAILSPVIRKQTFDFTTNKIKITQIFSITQLHISSLLHNDDLFQLKRSKTKNKTKTIEKKIAERKKRRLYTCTHRLDGWKRSSEDTKDCRCKSHSTQSRANCRVEKSYRIATEVWKQIACLLRSRFFQ